MANEDLSLNNFIGAFSLFYQLLDNFRVRLIFVFLKSFPNSPERKVPVTVAGEFLALPQHGPVERQHLNAAAAAGRRHLECWQDRGGDADRRCRRHLECWQAARTAVETTAAIVAASSLPLTV